MVLVRVRSEFYLPYWSNSHTTIVARKEPQKPNALFESSAEITGGRLQWTDALDMTGMLREYLEPM